MTSRRTLAAVGLLVVLAACGPAPSSVVVTASDGGAGEALYTCGHDLRFSPDALAGPPGAEQGTHPAADALRAQLVAARAEGFLPQSGYRLVAETPDAALFLAELDGEEGWASVLTEREGGAWAAAGWGHCRPERHFEGMGVGTWQLDPSVPPPGPDTTELSVLVTERACASGESSAGRIVGPLITERPDAVVVVFAVRPLGSGPLACPGNPPVRVLVELPSPLGDRDLLDGAFLPASPPTGP